MRAPSTTPSRPPLPSTVSTAAIFARQQGRTRAASVYSGMALDLDVQLGDLGRRHVAYGARPEHERAWSDALTVVAGAMLEGAASR